MSRPARQPEPTRSDRSGRSSGRAPEPLVRVDPDFEEEFPGADAAATECYANIVRTGDLLIGLHNAQVWADYRLSASGKQALAILDGAGEALEPGVIAERLIITSGSMTSLLDTLEKGGYLRRSPHPADRRKVLVEITDAGVDVVDAMLPALHSRERTIIGDALSREEQADLLRLLAKVQSSARAHTGDGVDRTAVRRRPDRLARQSHEAP